MQPCPSILGHGTLDPGTIDQLLREVAAKALTGSVTLHEQDGAQAHLVFQRGRLVQVGASERHRPLGELLLESKALNRRDLTRALRAQQRHPGRRIGQLLEGLGVIDRSDLRRALRAQAQKVIDTTRQWTRGRYTFQPDKDDQRHDVKLGLNELLTPAGFRGAGPRPLDKRRAASVARNPGLETTGLLHFLESLRRRSKESSLSENELLGHLLDYAATLCERAFLFELDQTSYRLSMRRDGPEQGSGTAVSASCLNPRKVIPRGTSSVLERVEASGQPLVGSLEATTGNANLVESLGMSVPRWAAAMPLYVVHELEYILYVDASQTLDRPPIDHLEIACLSTTRECELVRLRSSLPKRQ